MVVWWGMSAALAGTVESGCPAVGDVVRYQVDSDGARQNPGEAVAQSEGLTRTVHRFEVLSVDGTVIRLSDRVESEAVLIPPSDPSKAAMLGDMAGIEAPPLVLVLDAERGTLRVEDVAPLLAVQELAFDKIAARMAIDRPDQPAEQRDQAIARARELMSDPMLLQVAAVKSLLPLGPHVCRTFTLGRTEYQTDFASPVSEGTLLARAAVEVAKKGKTASVRIEQHPDAEALKDAALTMLRRVMPPDAPADELQAAVASLAFDMHAETEVGFAKGAPFPDRWTWTRTITASGGVRTERTEVTRLD